MAAARASAAGAAGRGRGRRGAGAGRRCRNTARAAAGTAVAGPRAGPADIGAATAAAGRRWRLRSRTRSCWSLSPWPPCWTPPRRHSSSGRAATIATCLHDVGIGGARHRYRRCRRAGSPPHPPHRCGRTAGSRGAECRPSRCCSRPRPSCRSPRWLRPPSRPRAAIGAAGLGQAVPSRRLPGAPPAAALRGRSPTTPSRWLATSPRSRLHCRRCRPRRHWHPAPAIAAQRRPSPPVASAEFARGRWAIAFACARVSAVAAMSARPLSRAPEPFVPATPGGARYGYVGH